MTNATEIYVTNYTQNLVDVPLSDYGVCTQSFSNFIGTPELLGGSEHLPGRPGLEWIIPQTSGRKFSIGITLHGFDTGSKDVATVQRRMLNNLRSLGRLLWSPGRPLLLTRRLDLVDGVDPVIHQAEAVLDDGGFAPDIGADSNILLLAKQVLSFTLLPGYWLGPEEQTTIGSGGTVITVDTDDVTPFIRIVFTGGSNMNLQNGTTGHGIVFSGTHASPVELNVMDFTAVMGGTDMYSQVQSQQDLWFALAPGDNFVSASNVGSVDIYTRGAYL